MRGLFKRGGAHEPGWLAISLQPGALHFAHGVGGPAGKSAIKRCGTHSLSDDRQLDHIVKELGFHRHQCLSLLASSDYQLLLVEAPNVPPAELKTAVRWRIKDMLDYHIEDATIDVLDIPADPGGASRAHSMYAVAAKNEVIQGCIERFTAARIPLSVIDIAETAQRNIAALLEPADRGAALLYVDTSHALLTINFRGELYLARRIDVGLDQLGNAAGASHDEGMNRILLELQRSFDHLDRQFPFVGVAKLLLAPTPSDTGLRAYLSGNLDIPVEEVRFGEMLNLAPEVQLDGEAAWRLFHVVGAALRYEAKAL